MSDITDASDWSPACVGLLARGVDVFSPGSFLESGVETLTRALEGLTAQDTLLPVEPSPETLEGLTDDLIFLLLGISSDDFRFLETKSRLELLEAQRAASTTDRAVKVKPRSKKFQARKDRLPRAPNQASIKAFLSQQADGPIGEKLRLDPTL